MFKNTIAVGPLEPTLSCVTGYAGVASHRELPAARCDWKREDARDRVTLVGVAEVATLRKVAVGSLKAIVEVQVGPRPIKALKYGKQYRRGLELMCWRCQLTMVGDLRHRCSDEFLIESCWDGTTFYHFAICYGYRYVTMVH